MVVVSFNKRLQSSKRAKEGLTHQCRSCINAIQREHRKTIREKRSLYGKIYNITHREQIKERNINYRKNNLEKIKEKDKIRGKEYREKYPEKRKEIYKKYALNNKEKIKSSSNEWRKNNKDKINAAHRKRRKTNINYNIKCRISNRLRHALRRENVSKTLRSIELIGCSIPELKQHLESKFLPTMTWENYGKYWHIDHIIPCSKFDLTKEEEQRKCFHYTNLQPLFAVTQIIDGIEYIGNINKGNRYEKKDNQ